MLICRVCTDCRACVLAMCPKCRIAPSRPPSRVSRSLSQPSMSTRSRLFNKEITKANAFSLCDYACVAGRAHAWAFGEQLRSIHGWPGPSNTPFLEVVSARGGTSSVFPGIGVPLLHDMLLVVIVGELDNERRRWQCGVGDGSSHGGRGECTTNEW